MNRVLQTILAVSLFWSCFLTAQAQLYVACRDDGTIREYDAATGALINGALVSGLSQPHGLAYSDGALYVTQYGNGTIGKYDARTGAAINVALVTGLTFPQAVAVSGNVLFVTSLDGQGTGMVGKYDAVTGAPISPSLVVRLNAPMGVVVSENHFIRGQWQRVGACWRIRRHDGRADT
jgi:outer membrane protein assembly factor BamB